MRVSCSEGSLKLGKGWNEGVYKVGSLNRDAEGLITKWSYLALDKGLL